VRYNLRSGRSDQQGAARLSLGVIALYVASWVFGARHNFAIDAELGNFFKALAMSLLNVGFTWLFYLGLEPFVRRFCPDMLIGWTRFLRGRFSDPRVGRDLLVGLALGVFVVLLSALTPVVSEAVGGVLAPPRLWNAQHLFGLRHGISMLLRVIPGALQSAMLGTFAYVVLLGLIRKRSIALGIIGAIFIAVVFSEGGADEAWLSLVFATLLVGPILFVFDRFGLLALAAGMIANQALQIVPLTLDLSRPYAATSTLCFVAVLGAAIYAFRISRAGDGLFRRLMPSAQ
jgi:hypothetical protein